MATTMDWTLLVHLAAALLVFGGTCAWAIARKREVALAKSFAVTALLIGPASLILVAARNFAPDPFPQIARTTLSEWPIIATWLVGAAVVMSVASIAGAIGSRAIRLAAIGGAVLAASSFLGFELGKIAHDAEMRQFFLASDLPVWFMYVVMAAESGAAIALLFDRTRTGASAVLVAIMMGAIGTHVRNGDPASDSSDAIRMLLLVAAVGTLSIRTSSRPLWFSRQN